MTTPPGPLADTAEEWPVTRSVDLHRDDWVMALRRDTIHAPGRPDETFGRLVLEHPGAVVVLAVDDRERAFCLWQYRHPARTRFVEFPAGLMDGEDEDPVEVAARELREEAQLAAGSWHHLISMHSSPGITSEVLHLYLARDLTPVDRGDFELRHEEQDMDTGWVSVEDLVQAAVAGRITDGPLLVSLLLARSKGLI